MKIRNFKEREKESEREGEVIRRMREHKRQGRGGKGI